MSNPSLTKYLQEPLLHFLLIGACLFGLYTALNPALTAGNENIVIDAARIKLLQGQFERAWQRPASPDELDKLIDNYIVEEILVRQALAMGLDQGDPVIRQRLRQQMEFIVLDTSERLAPNDQELATFLREHPEQFQRHGWFSFEQVYISADHPATLKEQPLTHIRQQLVAGESVDSSPSIQPRHFRQITPQQVNRQFGDGFAAQLETLPLNHWSQPLRSGLGVHFIKLAAYQAPTLPQLTDIYSEVKHAWQQSQSEQLKAALLEQLKAQYTIDIDRPADDRRLSLHDASLP